MTINKMFVAVFMLVALCIGLKVAQPRSGLASSPTIPNSVLVERVVFTSGENGWSKISDKQTLPFGSALTQAECSYPIKGVQIEGPNIAGEDVLVPFEAVISPINATEPIEYTWSPQPQMGQGTTQAKYYWNRQGTEQIKVQASNCGGSITDVLDVQIVASTDQVVAMRQLQQDSIVNPSIRFENGIPRNLTVRIPIPDSVEDDPLEMSFFFLEQYKDLFLLLNPRQQLQLERRSGTGEEKSLFFRQIHQDIPILGSAVVVRLVNDEVRSVSANYLTDLDVDINPSISSRQAERIAHETASVGENCILGKTSLMILDYGLFNYTSRDPHLVWRASVGCSADVTTYIDAINGEVLHMVTHNPAEFDLGLFTANNNISSNPNCFQGTDAALATQWYDESGIITGATPDTDGADAFTFIDDIYTYFDGTHGRDSFDGRGGEIRMYIHYDVGWRNARSRRGCGDFIYGDGLAVLDVMTHEYTHKIIDYSSNLNDLGDSDTLEESYGDVFGAMIDDDWTLGENITVGMNSCPGFLGTFRSLENPAACISCNTWDAAGTCTSWGRAPDHMDKYINAPVNGVGRQYVNAGIPNRAAHILSEGGVHPDEPDIVVRGIGRVKVSFIYYKALTELHSSADFEDVRMKSIEVAQSFVDEGLHGMSDEDVCSVKNAFAAVGIGPPDFDCDGIDDDVDPDDDGDSVEDGRDNCLFLPNMDQTDTDEDGQGDACDQDDDGDGLNDELDNCPLTSNACQYDEDGDGVGEACDDEDGDGVFNDGDASCSLGNRPCDSNERENCDDNCAFTYNYRQEDLNDNGIGDVCDADPDGDGIPNHWGDNCPEIPNQNQDDQDGDGYGDACDNCIDIENDQNDVDDDGYGDDCDSDIDGDGISNGPDNCPYHHNPGQSDMDHNGMGSACDVAEGLLLAGDIHDVILGDIRFRDTLTPLNIEIYPCLSCQTPLAEGYQTDVILNMALPFVVRILDDQGMVITADHSDDPNKTLSFLPAPNYSPPMNPYNQPYGYTSMPSVDVWAQKPQYTLQILPIDGTTPDKAYPIMIDVESFTSKMYLPLVSIP